MEWWKIFEQGSDLAQEITRRLTELKRTVSTAESCTGGWLASFLTETPGSSQVFEGGVSCYSNDSKTKVLSVSASVIHKEGAVSEHVARDLAKNVRTLFRTDYGLGVTGIAGPEGGTADKPVGTVWCSIQGEGIEKTWKLSLNGDRRSIRLQTAERVLFAFLQAIEKGNIDG